jgi:hypothetical protein
LKKRRQQEETSDTATKIDTRPRVKIADEIQEQKANEKSSRASNEDEKPHPRLPELRECPKKLRLLVGDEKRRFPRAR